MKSIWIFYLQNDLSRFLPSRSIEGRIIFFICAHHLWRIVLFFSFAIRHLSSNFYTIAITDRINKRNKFGYFRQIPPLGKKTNRPNRGIYMKITGEYPLYIPTRKKKSRYFWFQVTGENSEICFSEIGIRGMEILGFLLFKCNF